MIHKTNDPSLKLNHSTLQVSPVLEKELKAKLLVGVPLATLMAFSEFYHHRFYVNENVLIPRPETELMVDILIEKFSSQKIENVLDVGTGSGVILLSLLDQGIGKFGTGVDLSQKAIEVAQINSSRLRLTDRVEFLLSDRLEKVSAKFDLIVSNPPYIKAKSHRSLVHASVDRHEPNLALYLEDSLYENWFYEFFSQVKKCLRPSGVFMMEGHELELKNQSEMLKSMQFTQVEVLKDFSQVDRFLLARIE